MHIYVCVYTANDASDHLVGQVSSNLRRMKIFSAQVEEGKKGEDGKPSVGPVYRNLLSKHNFPPPDPDISTAWDVFRLFDHYSIYINIYINHYFSIKIKGNYNSLVSYHTT